MENNIQKTETITIEEVMANTHSNQEELKTIKLPSSAIKVTFSPKKLNGHTLMHARKLAGAQNENSLSVYIASVACLFDGEHKTVDEILELPMEDILTLEEELLTPKK